MAGYFVRYLPKKDDKDRVVEIVEVFATHSLEEFTSLQRDAKRNKKILEAELNEQRWNEKYSIKNLLIAINYAMPRGLIPGGKRTLVNETVEKCLKMDALNDISKAIVDLLKDDELHALKSLFEGVTR